MSLVNPHDTCRERLLALIDFARREGWEVRSTDDKRLMFVKPGLSPIYTPLPLDMLPPSPEERNA
jgi:hypothetical protein